MIRSSRNKGKEKTEKKARAAVVIISKKGILLMHRIKNGREYYVVPGGEIEDNETPEEAAKREIMEETNLNIAIKRELMRISDSYHEGIYYIAEEGKEISREELKKEIKIVGPEKNYMDKNNQFIPKWVSKMEIEKITLYPEKIKNKIMLLLKTKNKSKHAEITAKQIVVLLLIIAFFIAALIIIKTRLSQILSY